MATVTEEYKTLVLDDLNSFTGLNMPLHASVPERILTRRLSVNRIHPNPDDEFSMESIGPNYEIVGKYVKEFSDAINRGIRPIEEPLVVEKMSTGGYVLLNGHHRWMAAYRVGLKRVPVQVVNVTPEDEIFAAIRNSDKEMCVSFDLDEVLLTDGVKCEKDRKLPFPLNFLYKQSLRKNAGVLIKELRELGFDVWVYSGRYYSVEYINLLMRLHSAKVDGIVNSVTEKKNHARIKEAFREKYKYSLHIDNEAILCVNTKTKEFDSIDLQEHGNNWSAEVMKHIRQLEIF